MGAKKRRKICLRPHNLIIQRHENVEHYNITKVAVRIMVIFWVFTQRTVLCLFQRFEGTNWLHLQGELIGLGRRWCDWGGRKCVGYIGQYEGICPFYTVTGQTCSVSIHTGTSTDILHSNTLHILKRNGDERRNVTTVIHQASGICKLCSPWWYPGDLWNVTHVTGRDTIWWNMRKGLQKSVRHHTQYTANIRSALAALTLIFPEAQSHLLFKYCAFNERY